MRKLELKYKGYYCAFVMLPENAYAYVRILRRRSVSSEQSDMTWKEWQVEIVETAVRTETESGRLVYS